MGYVLYILLWIFCWPLALLFTVLHFLAFASEQAKQKEELKQKNNMLY